MEPRRKQIKKKSDDFTPTLQRWVGVVAIGPSALRGQGKGVLSAAQSFLGNINLSRIPKSTQKRYADWLDRQTESLLDALPVRNRPWGAARKALNLFMRDLLYNKYLSRRYGIGPLESWMEIPLDSAVARGLIDHAGRRALPRWPGLKHLTPDVSRRFQDYAAEHAKARKIERVHLDVILWLENRKKNGQSTSKSGA